MVLGIAIILVINAVALVGVWLNRRGEPLETIELTEREFHVPRTQDQDNSGISLRLNWAGYRFGYPAATANAGAPFDRDKLQESDSTAGRSVKTRPTFGLLCQRRCLRPWSTKDRPGGSGS